MNKFVTAVANQEARTANGMKARKSTANPLVDLFFNIGAMRGKNIIPAWTAARVEDPALATRIALWARDVRGGAGERKIFRDILLDLETNDKDLLMKVLPKVPELGRWDDLLLDWKTPEVKAFVVEMIRIALADKDGLCAKWMPRKGPQAAFLRNALGWTPKYYRKRLVELTKVVEQQMCAKEWDDINYSHVPSVAAARYKKAFNRHSPEKFKAYVESLAKGDKSVKVNASAVYPYDVLKGIGSYNYGMGFTREELMHITAQWDALPNYIGNANIMPIIDVSGSMTWVKVGKNSNLTPLDVAVSLGLYCADKNTGPFKDTFMTFSDRPELVTLNGNIVDKVNQMTRSNVGGSTNLHAAFDKLLSVAVAHKVPQEDMPGTLLIMSDMQFNTCVDHDDSAIQMIERKYTNAGYKMPNVVFWNLNAGYGNAPVAFDKSGTALVSGFSPAIAKAILAADMDSMSPEAIMMKAIMDKKYDH